MNKRLGVLSLFAASILLPRMVAAAATTTADSRVPLTPLGIVKPMFVVGPKINNPIPPHPSWRKMPQWNGSYTDLTGKRVNFTQIGSDPSSTNSTSTITVLLIPVKFVITQNGTKYVFDPETVKLANNHNRSVIWTLRHSPLFTSDVDFSPQFGSCGSNNSCVDLGKTQYIDAFQRGTWWGNNVGSNINYHVLFKTKVEPEQVIKFSCSNCVADELGVMAGTYDLEAFDFKLQSFMKRLSDVNPGVLPLFVSYDIYLTTGGSCCIGGYHNANFRQPNGQTYAYATYVDKPGAFSEDVSAFSHELGEWMDDPFVDNFVNCKEWTLMEVGDPVQNDIYTYRDHAFDYHLESLVYMPFFGAPPSYSANNWYAIQDDMPNACPGQ